MCQCIPGRRQRPVIAKKTCHTFLSASRLKVHVTTAVMTLIRDYHKVDSLLRTAALLSAASAYIAVYVPGK
jgi:hypothetical protein